VTTSLRFLILALHNLEAAGILVTFAELFATSYTTGLEQKKCVMVSRVLEISLALLLVLSSEMFDQMLLFSFAMEAAAVMMICGVVVVVIFDKCYF
jgi:hypothetical protein